MERYPNFIKKYKINSDIDNDSEKENIEPPIYSVDYLSKEFFNENSSKLRKRKVYFREFKINQEKETVNQSISSKEHIPIQNKGQVFKNYHIKLTDLHEEKVEEEKVDEEKVEEKLLNRLIKSLMNYLYFKN